MFNKRFNRLRDISLALVGRNSHPKCHHFTFAYHGNKLLAIGMNKAKTHPINLSLPYYNKQDKNHSISSEVGLHSEVDCILKLGMSDCSKLTFFNFRIDKLNNVTISRPCNGCSHLLKQVGYKNIYFTNKIGELEKLI